MEEERLKDDDKVETDNQPQEIEDEFTKEYETHKITRTDSKKEKSKIPYSTKKPTAKSLGSRESLPRGSKMSLLKTLFNNSNVNQLHGKTEKKKRTYWLRMMQNPEAKSNGAAGFDIFSNDEYTILPGEVTKIKISCKLSNLT